MQSPRKIFAITPFPCLGNALFYIEGNRKGHLCCFVEKGRDMDPQGPSCSCAPEQTVALLMKIYRTLPFLFALTCTLQLHVFL